jgi:hypothetical protein
MLQVFLARPARLEVASATGPAREALEDGDQQLALGDAAAPLLVLRVRLRLLDLFRVCEQFLPKSAVAVLGQLDRDRLPLRQVVALEASPLRLADLLVPSGLRV